MGLSDLRDIAVITPIEYDELSGATAAVDAFNWLHRYLSIVVQYTDREVYRTADGTEVPNLVGLVQGLPKFFEHDLFPVFVFEGHHIDLKEPELEARRQRRREAETRAEEAEAEGREIEAARYRSRAQRMTSAIERTTRELLDHLDVPYLDAPTEAEAQAAHMARAGDVDYVISDDYDCLLYGTPLTIRQFTTKGNPECMDFEATLETHELTRDQLVAIAILCGTDYNEGIHGVGPKTALEEVKEYGSLAAVLDRRDVEIVNADRIRDLFLNPTVTDDYHLERSMAPDFEAAWDYVTDTWEIPGEEIDTSFDRLRRTFRTA